MSTKHARRRRRAPNRGRRYLVRIVSVLALVVISSVGTGSHARAQTAPAFDSNDLIRRTIDGSNNNLNHPTWGQANVQYRRQAAARYADGVGQQVSGAVPRFTSNRVFNDVNQNLFSENRVSQWGFTWGQFLDHTFGLRQTGGENAPLAFNANDRLESFRNDFGNIGFQRSGVAPGTGVNTPRQQINTIDSYIDASAVYGNSNDRIDWLRAGTRDGNPSNNSPSLLLDGGYLPKVTARGNAGTAPAVDRDGRLLFNPNDAVVAGDVRANENIALTATHTLFAREHNRIVNQLPSFLSADVRFEIARKVVGAEQEFITYNEFLPALGVRLAPYQGYNPNVDATLSNEFATVGYRAHSMIHGEVEPGGEAADYTQAELDAIEAQGVEVVVDGDEVEFVVPLNVAFFNPNLLRQIGLGAVLKGIGGESEYKNDEQIDNQLRSVLFQVPKPGVPDPSVCLDGPSLPDCFQGVADLGAIDIQRGRDHGMPTYNGLRAAYGLPAKSSFTSITGENTQNFPLFDPQVNPFDPLNDPDILDFVQLRDIDGNIIPLGSEEADTSAVTGIRRTTLAARLRGIYGSVGNVDPFVGMISERHVAGTEFGELQLAIWKREFERLRDGDRFFYANDSNLDLIRAAFGIDFRRTLAQVITDNTELNPGDIAANVFVAPAGG
jgi:hypothetical protein